MTVSPLKMTFVLGVLALVGTLQVASGCGAVQAAASNPAVQQGIDCAAPSVEAAVIKALPQVILALLHSDPAAALAAVDALLPALGIGVLTCAVQAVGAAAGVAPGETDPQTRTIQANAAAWLAFRSGQIGSLPPLPTVNVSSVSQQGGVTAAQVNVDGATATPARAYCWKDDKGKVETAPPYPDGSQVLCVALPPTPVPLSSTPASEPAGHR